MQILETEEWEKHSQLYYQEIHDYAQPARERKSRREKHPIFDFLHTYYTYSWGNLEKWHPGLDYGLKVGESTPNYYTDANYKLGEIVSLDKSKLNHAKRDYFTTIRNLLAFTQARKPHYRCYGLHEWAMVYKATDKEMRHIEQIPLRLKHSEINAVVESKEIQCSHFDAYRFFTQQALPLNYVHPTLDTRQDYEQPACIHANMDLYKWAYKCMPWIGSNLLKQTFLFALKAREIDMRASPYDMSLFGYTAIPIETTEGRAEYVQAQQELYQDGRVLRTKLINAIDKVLKI